MSRGGDRTQDCGPADAAARLRHGELYLSVAETVLGEEPDAEATVATGNAVAGIAAADAICCAVAGSRYRGGDHRRAADHLEAATGDRSLAALLRDLVDLKDAGHYGFRDVAASRAKATVRKARQLVERARTVVR